MSAYVIVELAARMPRPRIAIQPLRAGHQGEFGGEFVAGGVWTTLAGEPGLRNGAVIRFADGASAMASYGMV